MLEQTFFFNNRVVGESEEHTSDSKSDKKKQSLSNYKKRAYVSKRKKRKTAYSYSDPMQGKQAGSL